MRLNKYLSQAGIASRRKSDELIKMATTTVNGKICLDPAYDVKPNDIIAYENYVNMRRKNTDKQAELDDMKREIETLKS